ncbi:hypothetical protein BV898_19484 [Hypsibius exemplaris]|uniref:Uncharacterized protein n=1 Tax=Hypsibius exemplaris TaxID=2072580 RepID=A0A9X6RPM9_HYPEX|nr:hypothetical protein BV898_19484 [Hypsibius exemplaris]
MSEFVAPKRLTNNKSTINATFKLNLSTAIRLNEDAKLLRLPLVSVLSVVIYILGLLLNGSILFVFAKNRALRTPFNVYIINLLRGTC